MFWTNDLDDGAKCKSADDPKLWVVVDAPELCAAFQRHHDRLEYPVWAPQYKNHQHTGEQLLRKSKRKKKKNISYDKSDPAVFTLSFVRYYWLPCFLPLIKTRIRIKEWKNKNKSIFCKHHSQHKYFVISWAIFTQTAIFPSKKISLSIAQFQLWICYTKKIIKKRLFFFFLSLSIYFILKYSIA